MNLWLKFLILVIITNISFLFAGENNYKYFLNNRGVTLRDIVKSVVKDQQENKQNKNEQEKSQSFSSKGGGGSVYSLGAEDYQEKNRLTVFPDVKMAHRELPGVSDGGDYDASLFFRGGGAHETITLVNGQPVYEAFVFDGKGSLINPHFIKTTKVYTSGIPVSYPDVLSGVVDVTEKEGDRYRYRLDVGQSLTDFQLLMEGPIIRGKSSFIVSLRRTYYDYILQILEQGAGRIAPHLENYGQKFFLKLSPEHEMVVDFKTYYDFYKFNNKDFNLGQTGEHNSISRRNFLQTKITSFWDENIKSEVVFGLENSTLSRNSTVGVENVSEKVRQEPLFVKTDFTIKGENNRLMLAGFYYRQENIKKEAENLHLLANYGFPGIAESVSSEGFSINYPILACYFQDEVMLVSDKVFLETGVRYSFINKTSLSKSNSLQPRIGLRIEDNDVTFKFSVGKYSQYDPKVISAQFVNLLPEEATQYNVGIEHRIGDIADASVSIYKKDYSSLIVEQTDNQGLLVGYDNSKEGRAQGIEFFLKKKKQDGWKGMVAYTNQEAYYTDSLRGKYYAGHDQRHTFSLSGEVDLGKDWSVVLDWQYHSGRPYTDLTGATSANVRSNYLENTTVYNKSRLPDYSNLTLILQYNKPIWPFNAFEGEAYVGVANLLNEDNVYNYIWNNDYSVRTAVKMMPMTPLFGVRVRF